MQFQVQTAARTRWVRGRVLGEHLQVIPAKSMAASGCAPDELPKTLDQRLQRRRQLVPEEDRTCA
jgi:hypothetical protein